MSITRYEDEVYGPSSYDFEENESGSWVKYEDHAAEVARLNEQVQALAAENAELRKWAKVVGFDKDTEVSANMEYGGFINALNCIKSDNTDVILNEVRAQAVEGFAKDCNDNFGLVEPEDEELYVLMAEAAKAYAAKLLAGEKT
ncbi:hypothetical protein [Winslowiella toletana]|uniref:hypothetical protein n=1 Tax=Winslowiella toletana TaxID=92490 RepID=UPI0028BEA10D|nr:hypothetical protein [Winslowiella toletana]WNN42839.1 hypothetical protein RIN69_14065 [Winslowiella toletana]